MSKPLPIDERRVDRIMRRIDEHEETCHRGTARCATCASLYKEATYAVNVAGNNAVDAIFSGEHLAGEGQ